MMVLLTYKKLIKDLTFLIRFNQSIRSFYAITLDLDNTLYNNDPVIAKAEEKMILFLRQFHPDLSGIESRDYYVTREIIKSIDPEIYHDVNLWRWKSLERILLKSGLSKHDAQLGADCGVDIIIDWRNRIDVPNSTHQVLSVLSARWPLIAITNGNADPILCGLRKYFVDILRAGIHGKAKPHKDMYIVASKFFGLSCKYILHIGDDLKTDIKGSVQVGMQSCWMNKDNLHCNLILDKKFLPHLEISELMSLTCLL